MHPSTLFAVLAIVSLLSGCSTRPATSRSPARKSAPDFALTDRHGGLTRLSDYRGRLLILDFWATWCGPCRIEIPWFNDLALRYKNSGLAVLGVSMDEKGWQAVDPFVKELKVTYPIVLGNDRIARRYGVGPPPTTFVIDRDGKIAAAFAGLVNRKVLEDEVQRLLQLPEPPAGPSK